MEYSQDWGHPIRSHKASWFGVLRFGYLWVVKTSKAGFLLSLQGFDTFSALRSLS